MRVCFDTRILVLMNVHVCVFACVYASKRVLIRGHVCANACMHVILRVYTMRCRMPLYTNCCVITCVAALLARKYDAIVS
jgi:hypothetical protein